MGATDVLLGSSAARPPVARNLRLFALESSRDVALVMAASLGIPLDGVELRVYDDGECKLRHWSR